MWDKHLAAGRGILWSPTIRAALIAGTQWLDVHCPGCGTSRAIDLRTIDRRCDPQCGGSEPRYEAIAMMSSSDRLATTGFINSAAFPALEPCRISNSCRAT